MSKQDKSEHINEDALDGVEKVIIRMALQDLQNEDPQKRITGVRALKTLENPKGVEALIKTLNDENPDVREEAVEALGVIRDRRAIQPLQELSSRETDPKRRAHIISVLTRIEETPPDMSALAGLFGFGASRKDQGEH